MEERFSFKNMSVLSNKVISRAILHDIDINELVVSHSHVLHTPLSEPQFSETSDERFGAKIHSKHLLAHAH